MRAITRRRAVAGLATVLWLPRSYAATTPVFFRNPGCQCCHVWTERMQEAGLPVILEDTDDLDAVHTRHAVPDQLRGCHVGEIAGYAISGHVPPSDILRLISERPTAIGLAVPGMPLGSPGMEAGGQLDAYSVILFTSDGQRSEYARYG